MVGRERGTSDTLGFTRRLSPIPANHCLLCSLIFVSSDLLYSTLNDSQLIWTVASNPTMQQMQTSAAATLLVRLILLSPTSFTEQLKPPNA